MPRIKRWFPVSHDINRDPEMWDLCAKFGEKALRCWLEILSIADRNEGEIPGQIDSISTSVSWAIRCNTTKTRQILNEIMTLGWIKVDGGMKVSNYKKYHVTRDDYRLPKASHPSEPSEPSEPKEDKEAHKALFILPEWIPEKSWKDFEEHRRKIRCPLSTRAKELALKQLELLRREGHEPGMVLDNCIAHGWRGIFAPKGNGAAPKPPMRRVKLERPPDLTDEQIEKNKQHVKELLKMIG